MKKILILHTSVGLGHKYIAENIAYHLQKDGYEILLHDILQVQEGLMVDFGVWLHSFINRRLPFVWRWIYFSKIVNLISLPLRVPLAKGNSERLHEVVKTFRPDCILSTQTTASAATAALIEQKLFFGKFIIAFSDYHLHKFWLYDQADLYLANIEEQKQEMMALGIPEKKIAVCGITLKPKVEVDKDTLRQKLGIDDSDKIIIFASGSLGIGFDASLLQDYLTKLTSRDPDIYVLVLCGKNLDFKKQVENFALSKVTALGFYDNPTELYQIAEVLVTKPGGLTIAEALQAGIRIQITHTLPGQEEPNYEYLIDNGLVNPIPEPLTAQNLCDSTLKLLNTFDEARESPGETKNGYKITQSPNEGKVLKASVNSLFHG
ncbi:hypothetical protein IPM19_04555 [bacterium]|nr:MAG: hypothetical protein IPM19_04555 [bacterium]